MKDSTIHPILLADYKPPAYLIKDIALCFDLDDEKTLVSSKMTVYRNPANAESTADLTLNGENLTLLSIKIDNEQLKPENYVLDKTTLTIKNSPSAFVLEIDNEINPKNNAALDGLYKSGSIFCTQNEPEGFRKITYFLDRSDVMATYTTKIIADKRLYPTLLSNGNKIGGGQLNNGKHWVEWQDPFAKPSYLFALVAGDLGVIDDEFVTRQGKKIELKIYCDKGNEEKCRHAMRSLINAMKWDEETFGLEYDLDIYMIVAVDAFNMGGMENKGLNIFNTSCVLADEATATDENFARVETVIAHEYFHNWTGNRVTCRDWFQLTLKEGLTVFRDQEFSADMHSRSLQRVENVLALRARQFPEDAGPTAHPIKPTSYIQINNFYTPTVYNKGAEVIRMIQTLIGKEAFRRGMDKYFELYDGQAVTTEDFVHAMELSSGKDLAQFKRWYTQAGTPEIAASFHYDRHRKTFALTIKQTCAPTADNSEKEPFHFPLALGLIGKDGKELPLKLAGEEGTRSFLEITREEETFIFENVFEPPLPSINRHFSAPIKTQVPYHKEDLTFLIAHDADAFNRWEAGQTLASDLILALIDDLNQGNELIIDSGYVKAFGAILNDKTLDRSLKAKALILPQEAAIIERQDVADYDGVHIAREFIRQTLADAYQDDFRKIYAQLNDGAPYRFDAESAAKRSLKNVCLGYLACLETPEAIDLCYAQFEKATNMTDQFAALALLADIDCEQRQKALQAFYAQWKNDTLTMNKWLAVQALSKLDGTLETVKALTQDPVFNSGIPNLVRALIFSFTQNHVHFHTNDGLGYTFIADQVLQLDAFNPLLAAGLANSFRKFAKLDNMRKKAMKKELDRMLAQPGLSTNVYEIISKSLAWES